MRGGRGRRAAPGPRRVLTRSGLRLRRRNRLKLLHWVNYYCLLLQMNWMPLVFDVLVFIYRYLHGERGRGGEVGLRLVVVVHVVVGAPRGRRGGRRRRGYRRRQRRPRRRGLRSHTRARRFIIFPQPTRRHGSRCTKYPPTIPISTTLPPLLQFRHVQKERIKY